MFFIYFSPFGKRKEIGENFFIKIKKNREKCVENYSFF